MKAQNVGEVNILQILATNQDNKMSQYFSKVLNLSAEVALLFGASPSPLISSHYPVIKWLHLLESFSPTQQRQGRKGIAALIGDCSISALHAVCEWGRILRSRDMQLRLKTNFQGIENLLVLWTWKTKLKQRHIHSTGHFFD